MQPDCYEIATVRTVEERVAIVAVRIKVFVVEQSVPLDEEMDAYDDVALHFLARRVCAEGEEIVGTARLLDRGDGIGKVGRVAVLQAHRGMGVGALLMRAVEAEARERGFTQLDLDAQLNAIPFYEKLGYRAEGDIFLDCGIEHRRMRKLLHASSSPSSTSRSPSPQ